MANPYKDEKTGKFISKADFESQEKLNKNLLENLQAQEESLRVQKEIAAANKAGNTELAKSLQLERDKNIELAKQSKSKKSKDSGDSGDSGDSSEIDKLQEIRKEKERILKVNKFIKKENPHKWTLSQLKDEHQLLRDIDSKKKEGLSLTRDIIDAVEDEIMRKDEGLDHPRETKQLD